MGIRTRSATDVPAWFGLMPTTVDHGRNPDLLAHGSPSPGPTSDRGT